MYRKLSERISANRHHTCIDNDESVDPTSVVATTRRLSSDSGAFADWVATSSSAGRGAKDDLSLGFNAGPTAATGGTTAGPNGGMWSAPPRQINYGLSPEMGMVGLRDVFVVAPASSFNPNNHIHHPHETINSEHHSFNSSNPATALGVGVIPLLTAAHLAPHGLVGEDQEGLVGRSRGGGVQIWQNPQLNHGHYLKKQAPLDNNNNSANLVLSGGGNFGGASVSESAPSSTLTCQDCGNQAKKDCSHRRCRTCCRSRGFDCSTHVRSTWVPAARRRERQSMTVGASTAAGSSASTSGAKKPRLITSQTTTTSHTSTSNTTPRSFDTSSSQQDVSFKESFPGQVRAPAVFKCVRVTAVEDGEDEYAYQAVVKIGGHVFKGFLYDQGVESRDGFPNMSELHLSSRSDRAAGDIIESGEGGGGGRNRASSPVLNHPLDVYAASGGGGLLGGSSYVQPAPSR